MLYFEKTFGQDGAYAKYYFQEPHEEIDKHRRYPTIVICPGGAYFWTSFREDESVALRFLAEGFHVVVVHYATEGLKTMDPDLLEELPEQPKSRFPLPLISLAQAVSYLREHKDVYAVDEDYIVVAGFSAGGNVAAQLGTYWHEDWLEKLVKKDKLLYRPTHLLLAYAALDIYPNADSTVFHKVAYAATGKPYPTQADLDQCNPIKHVTKQTPPSFVWHTLEDKLVPASNALDFCQQLNKNDVPYELHIFNKGKHGLVLGDLRTGVKSSNQNAQVHKWVDLFLEWLRPYKSKVASFYKEQE